MPKLQGLGVISVGIILSLTIFLQISFGQIPTLDKLNLEGNQSPQCLDFNQDGICEYMVLANGTMVRNPDLNSSLGSSTGSPNLNSFVAGLPQQSSETEGKCMGFGYNYCKNLLMPDGSVIANPGFVQDFTPPQGVQTQTVEKEDDSNDNDNDNDNEIDNNNDGLDDRERNDEIGEDLPQEEGCQGDDDFCDADEGCRSDSIDCIDDREFDEDDYNG